MGERMKIYMEIGVFIWIGNGILVWEIEKWWRFRVIGEVE